jgi:3'-5' exonuclease
MKKLYFDIETIPADETSAAALEYLYERKITKKMKDKNYTREEAVLETGTLEKFMDGTGLDGSFGRIICLAFAINDDNVRVLCAAKDGDEKTGMLSGEKKLLEDFWFIAAQIDLFVGHNIMEFDLRFILQRSIILGVKPTWTRFEEKGVKPWDMHKHLNFARYKNLPIFDTMQEWSNWGQGKLGLEHVALSLGIPTPKEGIDGSEVSKFFKNGKVKDICDYCMRDVETTRAVYKRMTFES